MHCLTFLLCCHDHISHAAEKLDAPAAGLVVFPRAFHACPIAGALPRVKVSSDSLNPRRPSPRPPFEFCFSAGHVSLCNLLRLSVPRLMSTTSISLVVSLSCRGRAFEPVHNNYGSPAITLQVAEGTASHASLYHRSRGCSFAHTGL